MSQRICLLTLVTLTFVSCAHSEPVSAAQSKTSKFDLAFSPKRLQDTYKNATSIKADFTQEVYQASLARTKTSSGILALEPPGKIRWEVREPEKSLTVSDGTKLWYYNPHAGPSGKGQAMERSAREITRQPLFRILTGSANLDNEFKTVKQERVGGIVPGGALTKVTLKPKQTAQWGDLEQVTLTVEANYLISEVIIHHRTGNRTKITLQNQTVGSKLSPNLFDFSPPTGADVVKD